MTTSMQTPTFSPEKDRSLSVDGHSTEPKERHPIDDDYNFHDASFRRHYQLNYADNGRDYEEFYAPAYRFGYELSGHNANANWSQVSQAAQSQWDSKHTQAWDDVAEAVHYGWTEERNPDRLRVQHHGQFEDYQPAFEKHFADVLQGSDGTFAQYKPVYNEGYKMAVDPAYRTHLWANMEPDVRAAWEKEYQHRFQWEDYRTAVRHAWQEVRIGTV